MDEVEAAPSSSKSDALMNKTIIQKAPESVGEGATSEGEGLQEDAGAAADREARQKAKSVQNSPSKSPAVGRGPPAPGGRSERPGRGDPEEPELDGAPQREARQDAAEGDPVEVVDGPVIPREAAPVDSEVPQRALSDDVAGAEAKEADVPRRG